MGPVIDTLRAPSRDGWRPTSPKNDLTILFPEILCGFRITWRITMLSYHRMISQSTHTAITCLLGMALLSLWPSLGSSAPTLPTLPQKYIDTTYSPPSGNTITVNAGGNLQTALNNANLGDTIVLQAGATFTGRLPCRTRLPAQVGFISVRATIPAFRRPETG